MLSKKLVGIICNIIIRFTFLQVVPLSWDSTENQLHVKCKFLENLQFYIQATAQIIVLLPVIVFLSRICIENYNNIEEIVIPVIKLISVINAVIFQTVVYLYRYEIVDFINKFLKFEASQRKFLGISSDYRNGTIFITLVHLKL